MPKVVIKKWKKGQTPKSYEYDVNNEEQYLQILLRRDKSRGYYRHLGEMNTCIEINPAGDAHSCMNYLPGIQLCDDKGNYKSYKVDYPVDPPKKTKKTKSKPGLSAPIAIPEDGYRNWTLVEEDVTYDKTKYKRFQSHEDALYAFTLRYQALEDAGYFRKSLKLDGTAKWEGEYITPMDNKETIKLMIV